MASLAEKKQLDAGAEDIRKLEATVVKKFTDRELKATRSTEDVIREKVTPLDGNIGLKLKEDMSPAESLQVLDWTVQMGDHFQFMIGDVMNFGQMHWSNAWDDAIHRTGRARHTLWEYANTARLIAPEKRVKTLPFTHHAYVARLPEAKVDAKLKELSKLDKLPSTFDLRDEIKKEMPKKKKKTTAPKAVKKNGEEEKLTAAEEKQITSLLDALGEAADAVNKIKLLILKKADRETQKEVLDELKSLNKFYVELEKRIKG